MINIVMQLEVQLVLTPDYLNTNVNVLVFFGRLSQLADKLTIHSVPCSWIL